MARGVEVSFIPSDVNYYYFLMDMVLDEYEIYLDDMDYTEIIET